jgi:hypothetical protein
LIFHRLDCSHARHVFTCCRSPPTALLFTRHCRASHNVCVPAIQGRRAHRKAAGAQPAAIPLLCIPPWITGTGPVMTENGRYSRCLRDRIKTQKRGETQERLAPGSRTAEERGPPQKAVFHTVPGRIAGCNRAARAREEPRRARSWLGQACLPSFSRQPG